MANGFLSPSFSFFVKIRGKSRKNVKNVRNNLCQFLPRVNARFQRTVYIGCREQFPSSYVVYFNNIDIQTGFYINKNKHKLRILKVSFNAIKGRWKECLCATYEALQIWCGFKDVFLIRKHQVSRISGDSEQNVSILKLKLIVELFSV